MYHASLALFTVSALHILYVYAIYPVFLIFLGLLRRRSKPAPVPDDDLPTISLLISAYNEVQIIGQKIQNTLALDYPADKLYVTVASDCSTDGTDSVIEQYLDQGIRFVRNSVQKGKIATIGMLAKQTDTDDSDLILITDANAMFEPNALRHLVRHFRDPAVGLVDGNRVLKRTATLVGHGEQAYWSYETILRKADSDAFSTTFVNGAMTAIRRELFIPIPGHLEFDHILPLHVVDEGYRAVFDDEARFYEETGSIVANEFRVRVRNATRGFAMVFALARYLRISQHPWYTWHLISRKILRWLVAFPMFGLLLANLGLLATWPFPWVLSGQVLFYSVAAFGFVLERWGIRQRFLALPFYFCLINYASLTGFFNAVRGHHMAVWSTER